MDIWQGALSNVAQGRAFCCCFLFSDATRGESKGEKYFIAIATATVYNILGK
jgi:hypothetical protein